VFGSNQKDPMLPTSTNVFISLEFCTLFIGALDDLMLKVLIVAAVISIVISMIVEEDHRDIGNEIL
jgi:hypothetical protein